MMEAQGPVLGQCPCKRTTLHPNVSCAPCGARTRPMLWSVLEKLAQCVAWVKAFIAQLSCRTKSKQQSALAEQIIRFLQLVQQGRIQMSLCSDTWNRKQPQRL